MCTSKSLIILHRRRGCGRGTSRPENSKLRTHALPPTARFSGSTAYVCVCVCVCRVFKAGASSKTARESELGQRRGATATAKPRVPGPTEGDKPPHLADSPTRRRERGPSARELSSDSSEASKRGVEKAFTKRTIDVLYYIARDSTHSQLHHIGVPAFRG